MKRTFNLICKKCGEEFKAHSSTTSYCDKCKEELRKLTCVNCGEEFKHKGRLDCLPRIPVCDSCYEKLPRMEGLGKNAGGRKDSIAICDKGHMFRTINAVYSNGRNLTCPVCDKELRQVKCEICGKDFESQTGHPERLKKGRVINVCSECENELPGEGNRVRKCYTCGSYFKTYHNFTNCPVCDGISIAPREKICKDCGETFLTRNRHAKYCQECLKERKLSPAAKSFRELQKDKNNVRVDNIFMLPIIELPKEKPRHLSKKFCPECGREFEPNGTLQFRCNRCYPIVECNNCGEEYLTNWGVFHKKIVTGERNYCSRSCTATDQYRRGEGFTGGIKQFIIDDAKQIKSLEVEHFTELNDENIKEFDFAGIWCASDNEGFLYDIHWTTNIFSEYKRIKNISLKKYGKENTKFYYLTSFKSLEEGWLLEMMIFFEYGAKYWNPAPGEQQKLFKLLTQQEERVINWNNVHIGDVFLDGSKVEEIKAWETRQTYELTNDSGSIVVSDNHLIYCSILDADTNNIINNRYEKSKILRSQLKETNEEWICAEDIYSAFKDGYNIVTSNGLVSIIKLDSKLVRCISTNTGHYDIQGFENHNCSRFLYYGLSDTIIIDDCHNHSSEGILTCDAPGGFCEKCAAKSKMKNLLNILKKDSDVGTLRIGGLVSSNLSEPLTQSYLNAIHSANSSKTSDHELIVKTFQGHTMSPIIKAANEGKTTMEKRKILYNGLKQAYKDQGIKIDDWNIMVAAKKMTSYKYDSGRLRFVEPGEDCNIVSMNCIGNQTNIFKKASLGQSFDTLSKGGDYYKNPFDSFNDLMGNLD